MNSWKELENKVVKISEVAWCSKATPETVNGVKCDCVIKTKPNYWVIIEVSESNTLEKLRIDLAKFNIVRPYLFSKNIYVECYFITQEPNPSLFESGKGQNIEIHSPTSFSSKFLGSSQYISQRKLKPFGSAVDPDNGEIDVSRYIDTNYTGIDGKNWSIASICDQIRNGKKIILLGEFGSGKSRCLMEVFKILSEEESYFVPIAINLRDNWGYRKFNHILQNHLDELGLSEFKDSLVRSISKGNHPILLDGFDEIGSQSWSGDVVRLSEIRKGSLEGVRDLLEECKSNGVLITGREHYFNTDKEMLECLGLSGNEVMIVRCPIEFNEAELHQYLKERIVVSDFPAWLPRKPLLCQLLTRIEDKKLDSLLSNDQGEVEFFEQMLDAICMREAKIHPTIFKDSLKDILLEISTLSRLKNSDIGLIKPSEISEIFEKVTGSAPIDESAIVLQRLPYLGRSGSDSGDRVFIDTYAVDGLRALAQVNYFFTKNEDIQKQLWRHPLQNFGYKILGSKIRNNEESIKYFKHLSDRGNPVSTCDFIGAIIQEGDNFNFRSISINKGRFSDLDLSGKIIKNLDINYSEIGNLVIEDTDAINFQIDNCIIEKVIGITSREGFPEFITNTESSLYENVLTVSRISELDIEGKYKTLLSILKKLFFQPGKGRKEEALLRGTEKYWDEKVATKILTFMMNEKMLDKFKGDDGWVYFPTRSKTHRARAIMSKLANSKDPLWEYL